ncbi:MAG: hypothetical protein LBR29_02315 [Methylobacteriaceae bacterium]|nr:hypothetical protein [Methylobacteriaceae bacterium]
MPSTRLHLLTDAVRRLDIRALVLASAVAGFFVWVLPARPVLMLDAGFFAFLALQGGLSRLNGAAARTYIKFVVFWVAAKFLVDCIGADNTVGERLADAGVLALRLTGLALLGLIITGDSSPRALGQALSWFAKPLLREHSWKAALALSLMLTAMPRIGRTAANLNRTLRLRGTSLSIVRRFTLIALATLRIIAQEAESIAIAVMTRDLFRPEPWQTDGKPHAGRIDPGGAAGCCAGGFSPVTPRR